MDATTVKGEIKSWEREFRAQNGRNATVEDIKALPRIAEKYKLYKKLTKEIDTSKGKANVSRTEVPEPPRTPPPHARSRQLVPSGAAAPAAILPKSRAITSSADSETKNPFSPTKRTQSNAAGPSTSINPFLTPIKTKRTPSPGPVSPTQGIGPPAAQPNAAVIKARKRLRGESVSPSPLPRDKRRRANGHNPPADDRLSQSRSISPPPAPVEEGDSFLDESPVKPPAGGKAFRPLFEEAASLAMISSSQPAVSRGNGNMRSKAFSRAKTVPGGLFGTVKENKHLQNGRITLGTVPDLVGVQGATETVREANMNSQGKGKGKEKERPVDGAQKARKKRVLPGPKGLIPGKDDLFANSSSTTAAVHDVNSRKRSLSNAADDENKQERLLPPSPPPQQDNNGLYNVKRKGKGKGRDSAQRKSKKAKLSAGDEDGDEGMGDNMSSAGSADVEIVTWRGRPCSPQPKDENDLALALDPELHFHLRNRTIDERARSASPILEKFEVDLPEEMRRVLALSPRNVEREKEEENVVKALMRGQRRVVGQVWGPGEVGGESEENEEGATRAGEDDWEGEGIPWEVAEL